MNRNIGSRRNQILAVGAVAAVCSAVFMWWYLARYDQGHMIISLWRVVAFMSAAMAPTGLTISVTMRLWSMKKLEWPDVPGAMMALINALAAMGMITLIAVVVGREIDPSLFFGWMGEDVSLVYSLVPLIVLALLLVPLTFVGLLREVYVSIKESRLPQVTFLLAFALALGIPLLVFG